MQCVRTLRLTFLQVRKMYQLDANNFIMIFSHKWPLHVSDIYMSIFRSPYIQVVSLPHVVLCHRCWGCGPAELVCSLVRKNHNKIVCIKLVHLPYLYIWCTVTLTSNYLSSLYSTKFLEMTNGLSTGYNPWFTLVSTLSSRHHQCRLH